MTHAMHAARKIAELNTLFLTLDDKGQDSALTILRALEFAQSVVCPQQQDDPAGQPPISRSDT